MIECPVSPLHSLNRVNVGDLIGSRKDRGICPYFAPASTRRQKSMRPFVVPFVPSTEYRARFAESAAVPPTFTQLEKKHKS